MKTRTSVSVAIGVACVIGTVMLAAPGQDRPGLPAAGTERPGEPTKGQVWIENRGKHEAIPIVAAEPIPVFPRATRWEYQTITVSLNTSGTELARLLNGAGAVGWETSGIQMASGSSMLIVLKRAQR